MSGRTRFASPPKCDPSAAASLRGVSHRRESIVDVDNSLVSRLRRQLATEPWSRRIARVVYRPCSCHPAGVHKMGDCSACRIVLHPTSMSCGLFGHRGFSYGSGNSHKQATDPTTWLFSTTATGFVGSLTSTEAPRWCASVVTLPTRVSVCWLLRL